MALQTKTISANGSKGHHKFTLTVVEDAISTPNNYSVVKWSFALSPIKTGYDWSYKNSVPVSYTIKVADKTYTGSIMTYDGKSTVTVKSGEEIVQHTNDGSKAISYSFSVTSLNQSYLTGSASNSGSMDLTKIARAAKLIDADNFFDEANPNIYYTNAAGNSVEQLQAAISLNGNTADIAYRNISKTGDSYSFELTEAERNILRNATLSGSTVRELYFLLKTVISGTAYTEKLKRSVTIVNAAPTLSPTVEDVDNTTLALTGDKNKFIVGYSDAKMLVNATAKKGAAIVYQKIEVDGKTSTNSDTNANEVATYPNVNTPTFVFTAKDNRGQVVTKTITKTAVNYIKLTCNLEAEAPTTSGVLSFKVTGNYFSGSFGAVSNTLSVQYRYKVGSGSYGSWTTISANTSNGTYTATGTISGLDYTQTYTLQARAIDKLATIESPAEKLKTTPVFDWGENDFAFNVPVSIMGSELDYITDEGTKDGWFYRKWSNGKGECWKIVAVKTAITTAWGSCYVGNTMMSRQSYPFQFKSKPIEQATIQAGSFAGWLYAVESGNGVNGGYQSAIYNVCRPTSTTNTVEYYIALYAYGEFN